MAIPIAPDGWRYIGIGLLAAGGPWMVLRSPWAGVPGLLFAAFSVFFFRDPERAIQRNPEVAYAPGDGTVMSVSREGKDDITTLRVFLSVMNVHVQRAPVAARLEKQEYRPGAFHVANTQQSLVENERNIMTFVSGGETIVLEQIAGLVARRIKSYLKPEDDVEQGQRVGVIHFGSQLALRMPPTWEFTVKPGDVLTGGLTVVARRVPSRVGGPSSGGSTSQKKL